jgi:GAF domain-containing protein
VSADVDGPRQGVPGAPTADAGQDVGSADADGPRQDAPGAPTADAGQDVGLVMSLLARALHDRRGDVDGTLHEIASAAVENVPAAQEAGVSASIAPNRLQDVAATGDLPRLVVGLQTEVAQGPCLESLHTRRPVRVDDLHAEARWPAFTARMAPSTARSMLSLPLYVGEADLGSLSLYAAAPGAFDDRAEDIGVIFASHAAVALAGARDDYHLRLAMDSRDIIGQAKGVLIERYGVSSQQAFLLLTRVSQHRNVKLRDVAANLVVTGSLDPTEPPKPGPTGRGLPPKPL